MGWKFYTLNEICDIQIGRTPSRSKSNYWGAGAPWLSIADMNQGRDLWRTKEEITEQGIHECNCKQVSAGTLLLSFKLSIGKIGFARRPMYTNEAIAALPIVKPEIITREFLFWALQSINLVKGADKAAKGNTLNKAKLEKIRIPIPSLAQQKRIAVFLDEADALRHKRREAIAKLDTLAQSVFLEMFGDPVTNPKGWETSSILDVTTRITKGESPKWQGWDYVDKGIRFVTSENVGLGKIIIEADKFVPVEFDEKIRRSRLRNDDLLINLVGASIGRACLTTREILPANVNQAVAVVSPDKSKISPFFLLTQILTPQLMSQLLGQRVEAARANISLTDVGKLKVILPSLTMQKSFEEHAAQINIMREQSQICLDRLEALFTTLQHLTFQPTVTTTRQSAQSCLTLDF